MVVRDGRFYWSGWAMFWRLALTMFTIKFALRLAFALPIWRAEPELLGIPGMSVSIAGASAITSLMLAAVWVLLSHQPRRRFNAAAPRVPTIGAARSERDGIE
jgi:ABC-type Fe3+ transport system permease subunit